MDRSETFVRDRRVSFAIRGCQGGVFLIRSVVGRDERFGIQIFDRANYGRERSGQVG